MLCPFFGREKNIGSSAVGLMISLVSVCYGGGGGSSSSSSSS
jgi:hypothetical protein